MQCDNCKRDDMWLEQIGSSFICKRCVQKHKIMGLIFRTHADIFRKIIKKLKPADYSQYIGLKRGQIEYAVDLRKYGIKLETTNVIEL